MNSLWDFVSEVKWVIITEFFAHAVVCGMVSAIVL